MKFRNLVAAAGIAVMSATASFAAVIDLGFSLDGSGSVGSSNFNTVKTALSTALGSIPTDPAGNQYRVAVTQFGSSNSTIWGPMVVTAGNIGALQTAVSTATYQNGSSTQTASAINYLYNLFNNAGGLSDLTMFNITTDGRPCCQSNAQALAEAAALAAHNNGVDGISFEGVGSGLTATDLANMAKLAGLGTAGNAANGMVVDVNSIPNPLTTGFVIKVDDFADYEAAIAAKLQKVITAPVPLPAGLPLLLVGIGAFGLVRRKAAA